MPTILANRRYRIDVILPFSRRLMTDWSQPTTMASRRCDRPSSSRRRLTIVPMIRVPTTTSGSARSISNVSQPTTQR